jgi:hypothetical protein
MKSTLALAITSLIPTTEIHLAVSFGGLSSNVESVLFSKFSG